jgi:cytochrome c
MRVGLAVVLAFAAVPAWADAAAVRGEKAFQYCYACHSLQADEKALEGPNLRGVVGRRIAGQAGFPYSRAMRALAEREERWTPELLGRFLAAPYAVVPKTTMGFAGLPDEGERADLIAYLRSFEEGE